MLESPLRRAVKIYIGVRFLEDHVNSDTFHAETDYALSHEATPWFFSPPANYTDAGLYFIYKTEGSKRLDNVYNYPGGPWFFASVIQVVKSRDLHI